jgi:hypothetical protein
MDTIAELQAPEMRPFHVTPIEPSSPNSNLVYAPKGTENCPVFMAKRSKTTEKMMRGIETFFSNPEHMGKLLPFLQQDPKNKPKISMRLIEWFVCVYCMHHTVDWFLGNEFFNVYLDYNSMMKDNKKQRFDPFGRKWRKEKRKDTKVNPPREYTVQVYHGIRFYYSDTNYVITTVAQLNFFRWFIEKKILDYIIDHRKELIEEMNKYNQDKKKKKGHSDEISSPAKQATTSTQPLYSIVSAAASTTSQQDHKVRVQAIKKVTKKNVEVYVSFD